MEFEKVVSPQKDCVELLKWLQKRYSVTELELTDFSKSFVAHLEYNAVHAITNQKMMIEPDRLQFVCCKIESVICNDGYNHILNSTGEEFTYVIIEKNTGYILSNSNKIQLELVIERGVTKEDLDDNTVYMQYYLGCLRFYQEGQY